MTYLQRVSLFIMIDTCMIITAIYVSKYLVSETAHGLSLPITLSTIAIILSHHLFSVQFKLYKKVWEYASIGELTIIMKVATCSIFTAIIVQLIAMQQIYFKLLAVTWLLHLCFIGGSRFVWRVYRNSVNQADYKKRTLIVGAGSAGTMVARQLLKNNDGDLLPVAFIDDDLKKHQLDIMGIPVVGGVKDIVTMVRELDIDHIIISIPSLRKRELNIIFQECAKTKAQTKILPLLEDLITGRVSVNQFRDVQVEDLLGRDPVDMDMASLATNFKDKVVLITGAGGSIGSEIARQIAMYHPRQLILLGHGENSIYTIEMELRESYRNNNINFITEIADVQDAAQMMSIVRHYKPEVIYHAAAHKHVPLMERNPLAAVKNNMIGTLNVANAAKWHDVDTFVMVSTDKAVNPTSVMGASKRLAEMIVQEMNKHSKTTFVAVRFGNVLGSRGSVIPLFKKQIEKGGPITVTHPDMVRYFMTIPEASKLVIQAGALAKGGEIFVLDMGDPVKIVDLAKNLIILSGNTIDEIGIAYTGVRPGEKLYEELLKDEEIHEHQVYPKIYIGKTTTIYYQAIQRILDTYEDLDRDTLKAELIGLANNQVMHQQPQAAVTI